MERTNPFDYEADDNESEETTSEEYEVVPEVEVEQEREEPASLSFGERFKEFFESLSDQEETEEDDEAEDEEDEESPGDEDTSLPVATYTEAVEATVAPESDTELVARVEAELEPDPSPDEEVFEPIAYREQPQQQHMAEASSSEADTEGDTVVSAAEAEQTLDNVVSPEDAYEPAIRTNPTEADPQVNAHSVGESSAEESKEDPSELDAFMATVAASRARAQIRNRERKIDRESKKRDKVLEKKIEAQQQRTEVQQARLKRQIEEARTPKAARNTPEEPTLRIVKEQVPIQEEVVRETYSPDVHEHHHTREVVETHTVFEQPATAHALEQERRHEVKDDPAKDPVSFAQPDFTAPPPKQPSHMTSQSQRDVNHIGPVHVSHDTPHPKRSSAIRQTYKQAALSGVVAATVIIAILLVIFVAR